MRLGPRADKTADKDREARDQFTPALEPRADFICLRAARRPLPTTGTTFIWTVAEVTSIPGG